MLKIPSLLLVSVVVSLCSIAVGQDIPLVNGQATVDNLSINKPEGEFSIGEVNGQSTLNLRGVARILRIRKIDGQSTVNASCLVVQQVIIDELNGQSDLVINTAHFTFRVIDGQSVVLLKQNGPGALNGTEKIDGQSRILWHGHHAPEVRTNKVGGNSRVREVCF